jgi:Fusaric acid resistance protein-like
MTDSDTGGPSTSSGSRRSLHILGAVLVVVVLPAVLVGALVGELGVTALFVGLLLGAVGARINGVRLMSYVAPLVGLTAGLGAYTAYDWSWVALLACVGVITGAGIGFGALPALLMAAFSATFVVPVTTVKDAAIYGVIVALGTGYGIVLARRFGAPAVADGDRLETRTAVLVAIVFGLVLGASAAVGVALGWTEPYWVPEPVLILVLYIVTGKRDRIRGKAIGTSLGVAAAIPIAIISPTAGVVAAIGAVAFVLALTQSKGPYWRMYGLYTFSVVMLLSAPGQVGFEAEERGFQILVGIGLLVVGLAVVHALGSRLAEHSPQPELAT